MNTNAITALINGDIIAYPTESTWGLGVDATNEEAVYQLNVVKGRPKTKSFIVLVNRIDMVSRVFRSLEHNAQYFFHTSLIYIIRIKQNILLSTKCKIIL